jgi:alkylation response protein AidB-like acyl-CoA dehydrogenase
MLREETPAEQAFRAEARSWLEANLPRELRHANNRLTPPELKGWFRTLGEKGWAAPHWPKEHGGIAATPVQQVILIEELARVGAPDLPAQGLTHISPILIRYGTPEQKAQHLHKARTGEVIWAQGYSEPGSGSDLRSLRTKAMVEGDKLIINGHKIWTTGAQYADWLYLLVRTGSDPKARDSITLVLLDAKTPGVTPRGIVTLAGDDELCEVYLDNVVVPISNVVGKIGEGWTVGTALLAEERIRSGTPIHALRALHRLKQAARYTGADCDPWVQDQIARAEIEVYALEAAFLEALEAQAAGEAEFEDSSRLKLYGAEVTQFVLEVLQEISGAHAALRAPRIGDEATPDFSTMFLQSRRLSIRGGTNEIQRGIIAMRALGLSRPNPREGGGGGGSA